MLVTPSAFFAAATGLIRVGSAALEGYRDWLQSADLTVILPPGVPPTVEELENVALAYAFQRTEWRSQGGPLAGLWIADAALVTDYAPGGEAQRAKAVELAALNLWKRKTLPQLPSALAAAPVTVILTHKAWLTDGQQTVWGRLGIEIATTALSVISAQPNLLGLQDRAAALVGGVAQNLVGTLGRDAEVAGHSDQPFAARALSLAFRGALDAVAQSPEIILRDEHWAPVLAAFVGPLKTEVDKDVTREGIALSRLEDLLRGPMAHAAFKAVSDHADLLLTGRVGGKAALGAVTREVLGDLVSRGAGGGDVVRLLGEEGVAGVLRCSLTAVSKRPELFVRGESANADVTRTFVSSVAGLVASAPHPYGRDGGLGAEIAAAALDAASTLAGRRIKAGAGQSSWSQTGADAGALVVGEIFKGFKAALVGADGKARADAFDGVFDRELAVDVLKLCAAHVAKTPGMITGAGASPEVASHAGGIAKLIAEDKSSLLHAEDWRAVLSVTLDLAARNPGAILGKSTNPSPETEVGLSLARMLFSTASEAFAAAPRKAGTLLFGATLRDALISTFQAASGVVLHLQTPEAQQQRIAALRTFVSRLNAAAGGGDASLRMGAGEWLYVYRRYVAHVLDKGAEAPITEEEIRATLLGLDAKRKD